MYTVIAIDGRAIVRPETLRCVPHAACATVRADADVFNAGAGSLRGDSPGQLRLSVSSARLIGPPRLYRQPPCFERPVELDGDLCLERRALTEAQGDAVIVFDEQGQVGKRILLGKARRG